VTITHVATDDDDDGEAAVGGLYQYKLDLRVVLEERRLPLVEDAHVLLAASKQRLDNV
jgi:hypothetical protein